MSLIAGLLRPRAGSQATSVYQGSNWGGAAPQLLDHFPRPPPYHSTPIPQVTLGEEGDMEQGLREGTGPVNKFFPACSALNSPDPSQAENSISLKQLLC